MPEVEPSVDARVNRLFELPPEDFTAARDELARSLRDSDREAAAQVKQLRRPTAAAWALNQVARRHDEEIAELIEAGEQLRQAQRKALSGLGADPLRDAQARRRTLVTALADRAAAALRDQGAAPQAHAEVIRRALESASTDEASAEALRQARLSHPPEPATGFGAVEGLTLVPDAAERRPQGVAAEPTAGSDSEEAARKNEAQRVAAERAAARLAAAQRAVEKAAADASARRRSAEEAAQTAADARAEVERLTRELAAARDRARRGEETAQRAASRAKTAEDTLARRERERSEANKDAGQRQG